MELHKVKLLQRIASEAESEFKTARLEYIVERLGMDVRPVRIAEDLGVSKQYLNVLLKEERQQQQEQSPEPISNNGG